MLAPMFAPPPPFMGMPNSPFSAQLAAGWPWLVLAIIIGAVVGSFIGVVLHRMPQGLSVVRGRSACDHCAKPLRPWELVPIASFLIQRGRCRSCGAPIDRWQLAAEIGGAAIAGLVVLSAMHAASVMCHYCSAPTLWQMLVLAIFGWLLLLLGLMDLKHFWLPDRLTGLLAIFALAKMAILAWQMESLDVPGIDTVITKSLIGGVAGFCSLWLIGWAYRRLRGHEGLGGGDAKLLGAIGLCVGWKPLPFIVLGAAILGLIAAIILKLTGRSVDRHTRLPLGSLLVLSTFAVPLAML